MPPWTRGGGPTQAREPFLDDGTPLETVHVNGASESSQSTLPARPSPPGGADCRGVSPQQVFGEYLTNDPEWPGGSFLPAYMRLHHLLIEKAERINAEGRSRRAEGERTRREEAPSVGESLRMLRHEVFTLTPMRFLISGMLISLLLTILSFLAPAVSGVLVDHAVNLLNDRRNGIERPVWPTLLPNLLLYAFLLLSSYCCEIGVGILFAIAGHTTVSRLRIKLFRNLARQEIGFYDLHVSGELSSRLINDSGQLSNLTQFTTQTFIGAMVKFIGSLIFMYWTHPLLALIATFITPLNLILVRKTGHIVGHYGVVQNDAQAKANAVAVEVLGSIRTVQSCVGETMEANRFMDKMNYFLRVIKATVYVETVLRFTSYGLCKSRDIVIMTVAMHQVATDRLTIGSYTAFAQYVMQYESGFQNITDIWLNFKQTITSTGKFVQLLLRDPLIPMTGGLEPESCRGELHFENVTFAYAAHPDKDVLKGVDIQAVPGNIIALVGESGAGKTTLGRLLQRHYDPRQGRVLIDGRDYLGLNLRWLRTMIGVVEQEPVLFDRPICQNIAYGSAECKTMDEVRAAATLANAHNFISELEQGYNTHPGERACRMSGGQKQRVAIARAVVRDPKVLLLDEATSALDDKNEDEVQKALDALMEGKTTVIIAHRLSTVVRATRIFVLDKGQVIEQGSHDELVARDSKYKSFMEHQLVKMNPILQ